MVCMDVIVMILVMVIVNHPNKHKPFLRQFCTKFGAESAFASTSLQKTASQQTQSDEVKTGLTLFKSVPFHL